ncbi:inositol 2-dehydrogenase [Sinanaerobacter chloroacetimidivorans]|jgi:myo-inositol 2-dehydrogenase/D-chiro-inositol 1-dehydrogenase|uniref:Inositol 2-dehydrogenase n=1 Tax=Sinanaerobacter chloroacetimidivorans TaxID=2818044 RepID=A0A8J8B0E6_9FIRM|nr:inositol 2-dehydrogenase [Sinanaerobacter chloroacetimidivorans]MBR0597099.1 inositol 2-dehydrogenase [Sinanaerobacter chloroacetimidivorans]
MERELKIGMIGAGRIGRLHGNNLAHSVPGARLVSVADVHLTEDMKSWASELGVKNITSEPLNVINDKEIDAVFICSSTESHAELIMEAAKGSKHIFCEKPIHTDIAVIETALDEVIKAGVKLQVGFVRRFDHNHKKVRDTVASGRLGKPHIVKVTSRDPEPQSIEYVATSGGIFMDMTIHDFDMVRYLSGSEVTEVCAYGCIMIDSRIEKYGDVDTAIVILKFENGAIGVIENSRAARYGYDQRTEVHCDKGCIQVGNDLIDASMISTAEGVTCEKPTWFFLERYNNAFIAEARAFVDAVLHDSEPLVTGRDGLMPVYIAKAAEKSLKEGRSVKLSEVMA